MLLLPKRLRGRVRPGSLLLISLMVLGLTSCAKIDPRNVDVDLPSDVPEIKETNFDKPLADLGKMTQVYGKRVFIQGKDIVDFTGLSVYASGEIPHDITEMSKSALNAIGGNVVYIPYSPVFINNQMVTGYSNFQEKYIPDIVLSGGITEFDRGLETRGRNTDFGVTTRPFNVNQSWVPGDTISVDYNQENQDSIARITLDFNLLDFRTMSGVARMQTVNSINVYKATADKELGFTIFGPTFGLKGTVKKVQGRHAAIRLLVQTSILQVVGKYLYLPYWKLIPNMPPDPVVLERIREDFRNLSSQDKVGEIQTCLYLKGYNVPVTGRLDGSTRAALAHFKPDYDSSRGVNDPELYVALWSSLGENMEQVGYRRELLAKAINGGGTPVEQVAAAPARKSPAKAVAKGAEAKSPTKAVAEAAEHRSPTKAATKVAEQKTPARKAPKNKSIDKVEAGPAAVAKQQAAQTGNEQTALAKQQATQEEIAQLLRKQRGLGNSISAEALINERYMGQ
jgi:hypothetical protein